MIDKFNDKKKTDAKDFRENQHPLNLFEKLRDDEVNPKDVFESQVKFKPDLNEIKLGGHKSADQKWTTKSIIILFNIREKFINLFRDYSFLPSEAKYRTKYGEGLLISTPKQMIKRLPIALAQVNVGNNWQNLLNEIRQILYSLYQSNEITKKVYNKIIKSIQIKK